MSWPQSCSGSLPTYPTADAGTDEYSSRTIRPKAKLQRVFFGGGEEKKRTNLFPRKTGSTSV